MTHILGRREGGRREGAHATGQGPGQHGLSPSRGCREPPEPPTLCPPVCPCPRAGESRADRREQG